MEQYIESKIRHECVEFISVIQGGCPFKKSVKAVQTVIKGDLKSFINLEIFKLLIENVLNLPSCSPQFFKQIDYN